MTGNGKTIWMRLGVSVSVTDEEYDELFESSKNGKQEVDIPEGRARNFLKRAVADGDSYIPASLYCFSAAAKKED